MQLCKGEGNAWLKRVSWEHTEQHNKINKTRVVKFHRVVRIHRTCFGWLESFQTQHTFVECDVREGRKCFTFSPSGNAISYTASSYQLAWAACWKMSILYIRDSDLGYWSPGMWPVPVAESRDGTKPAVIYDLPPSSSPVSPSVMGEGWRLIKWLNV